ncbi:MAG: hypothetical protein IPJ58_01865 [Ardenticatenia bacterium]|nr:hypothetical protein [Ardenticatenia bacterium]
MRRGFHCGGIIIPTRRREFVTRPATLDEIASSQDKIHTWACASSPPSCCTRRIGRLLGVPG